MKKFSYKAVDIKTNRNIRGKMDAPNEIAIEKILAESNLILIEANEIKDIPIANLLIRKRITNKELITLFITLEQLERAGVPLLDSLNDIKNFTENLRLKDIMQNIYEFVKSGELLSTAMSKYNNVFSQVSVSLIAMGEKTGNLDVAFKNIYENLKWDDEMKRKTVKAVKSPLFSLLLLLVIAVILLKGVVPKVLAFILDQDIKVPGYTKALIKTSDFVQNNFLKLIVFGIGIFILIKILLKNKKLKIEADRIKLKLPLIGPIMQKINLSRFTKFFGITFSSGIPVLQCIEIANNVVTNEYLKNEIEIIKQKVSDGKSVSKCLEECNAFPFMVIRMFKVGENSGEVENAMKNIDYFYNTEINDTIDIIVGSLKPLIMFIMGGLMCWIIAAVFGPIYGNFSNMV